ncbi:MAG: GTP 3',8-cyclase MoaA [Lachnospiraceae bacterium]|nr:GTP 3',8-cyclase MoaA [Lachnospiraceae bacterium]
MIDKYGRTIDYLRISLTDRCNLRCVYCMPEEGIRQIPHTEILTYDEIMRICRCMADLGIRKIKLTGGEPLVRKDCAQLTAILKALPGIEKVTLTTNGILLREQLEALMEAGIDAVNISLDTLDPNLFQQITRRDCLDQVLDGLKAALSYPQLSVKLNCVPVIKQKENFVAMAGLAKQYPLHVRFIEMMPIGYGKQFPFQDEESIKGVLKDAYGPLIPVTERFGNGPCHYYTIEGFQGKIGFISAVTHKFCKQCNRVRLTAEGFLKGCLQFQKGTDLRKLLRGGCTDEELTEAIRQVIWNKPVSHNFYETETTQDETRVMSQIGG